MGRWEALASDVFRLSGMPASWRQSLMAACLAWGDGAVVSHRSAGALWHLTGFEGASTVELTVPRSRRGKAPGLTHRCFLPPVDVTIVEAIPVTTVARTLIDLAASEPRETVEEALDDALRRRIVSMGRLRWRVLELARKGRPGIVAMRLILDDREGISVPASVFETRLLRLLKRAGLPSPTLQYQVRSPGRLVAVVDFAWPDSRLALEADGFRWHSGRARFEHDRARRNELTLLGWRIIHVTWIDLTRRPDVVIDSVGQALTARS